jgi:hypothetical protein
VPPPGAKPTNNLIGLFGKLAALLAWASAKVGRLAAIPTNAELTNSFFNLVANMRDPQKLMFGEYYAYEHAIYTSSKMAYIDSHVAAQQGSAKRTCRCQPETIL